MLAGDIGKFDLRDNYVGYFGGENGKSLTDRGDEHYLIAIGNNSVANRSGKSSMNVRDL